MNEFSQTLIPYKIYHICRRDFKDSGTQLISHSLAVAYSEPYKTSKMVFFEIIVNGFQQDIIDRTLNTTLYGAVKLHPCSRQREIFTNKRLNGRKKENYFGFE